MRILLVEDDPMVGDGLQSALKQGGYSVDWVKNGVDAFESAITNDYKLIVLDMGLPEKSGMDVLKDLRERSVDTPILILTAQDAIDNRVQGLDSGADDYMVMSQHFIANDRIRDLIKGAGDLHALTCEF